MLLSERITNSRETVIKLWETSTSVLEIATFSREMRMLLKEIRIFSLVMEMAQKATAIKPLAILMTSLEMVTL
jgi:hypothetical protein